MEQSKSLGEWEVDLMLGKDHQGEMEKMKERKKSKKIMSKVDKKKEK